MFGLPMFGGIVANDSLVYIWKDNFVWQPMLRKFDGKVYIFKDNSWHEIEMAVFFLLEQKYLGFKLSLNWLEKWSQNLLKLIILVSKTKESLKACKYVSWLY